MNDKFFNDNKDNLTNIPFGPSSPLTPCTLNENKKLFIINKSSQWVLINILHDIIIPLLHSFQKIKK